MFTEYLLMNPHIVRVIVLSKIGTGSAFRGVVV